MSANETAPILKVQDITKSFTGGSAVAALRGVSFEMRRGERLAIMGPSGSGKSTLLNLICGLDEPTSGSVLFEGQDLSAMSDDDRTRLRREKIGMIFQTFNLLPTLTSLENAALPLRLAGNSLKVSNEKAAAMLERVGLTHRAHHRPDEMSGGERQRVAIARALIFEPPMLLADEPTGNLDSKNGDEILDLLDALHSEYSTTIVLVTHNELAASYCERHIALLDGMIASDETNSGKSAK